MRWMCMAWVMVVCVTGWGAEAIDARPSGVELLDAIDANLSSRNRVVESQMVIKGRRSSRTVVSKSWSVGDAKAFTEYLSPAREAGTKMLKLEDHLWTYAPATDRIIQISGHMLRQSVMGSDLSYEDMMDDATLAEAYEATVTGEETIDERDCWLVSLTARSAAVAYHARKLWVDKERSVPLRQDLFGKSGRLLKTMTMSDVREVEGRWFPMRSHFRDVLKKGGGTEFVVVSILFDQEIPPHIFARASLRK